ncbi:D-alanine--D-alanine ligase [Lutibacter sp.]|uniref:D-alanine--D-alanine ligase n=1 Tax=Lutibacter sp. TaxID=1925666 RepID=UPI003562C16E
MNTTLHKITKWEYWPSYMFYIPILPYAFYLALKAKSFGFFSAVNPSIEGAGNGLESKFKTLQLIPKKYCPKTIYIAKGESFDAVSLKINEQQLTFPLIIKPDIGFRGLLVKKLNSEIELIKYVNKYNSINLLLQEYINLPNECGIFFYRFPNQQKGKISSITLKKYLTIIGDGINNLSQLISIDPRARIYSELISEINKERLSYIPKNNEALILNIIGNHSKGTQFMDGNHLINEKLTTFLNTLNTQIDGWNYGRIDVKYTTFEELVEGKNFKVLELNGIISEPTHIYDASKGTYLKALKSIKNHWKILYQISLQNKKTGNGEFTNLSYFINLYFRYKKYLKQIKKLNNS